MKIQELPLLNRVFLSNPSITSIFPTTFFEDIIDPSKLNTWIHGPSFRCPSPHHEHRWKVLCPKTIYPGMERLFFYAMTRSEDLHDSLLESFTTVSSIREWLYRYSDTLFIFTYPIYQSNDTTFYSYHPKTLTFEPTEDTSYEAMIEREQYTIGNGWIFALSMVASNQWSEELFLEAIQAFFPTIYTVPTEWLSYYNNCMLPVFQHLLFYAFQYTSRSVYEWVYQYEEWHYYPHYTYYHPFLDRLVEGNLYTVLTHAKPDHFKFLKKIHQFKIYKLLQIHFISKDIQLNIHSHLLKITQTAGQIRRCLSNDLSWRFLIQAIYLNPKLGLMNFIQSICWLYHQSKVSKRLLTFLWRKMIRQFKSTFIHAFCGYMLEHWIQLKKTCLKPPSKFIRDLLYTLKELVCLKKTYSISVQIHSRKSITFPYFMNPWIKLTQSSLYKFHVPFKQMIQEVYPSWNQQRNQRILTTLVCLSKFHPSLPSIFREHLNVPIIHLTIR